MNASSRNSVGSNGASHVACACSCDKIRAVHAYLKEQFPEFALRDFHAPTRLMRAGLPMPSDEHHVVSLTRTDGLPYHAVLLSEFQEQSLADVCEQLRHGDLAETLRAHRIAVVSRSGASPL